MTVKELGSRDMGFETRVVRQAILEWLGSKSPMDRVLSETLREHQVGSQQRGPVSQAVFRMVRFWPMLVPLPAKPQNPEWLRELNEVIRRILSDSKLDLLAEHADANPPFDKDPAKHFRRLHGVPEFLIQEMLSSPKAWHLYLHQMFEDEAPLTVRLNTQRVRAEDFLKEYKAYGASPSEWIPNAVRFERRWSIMKDPGYLAGHFEIQDEHSQLVSLVADPKPGESVLDMCAGAGGKTLHLANLMENKGEIVAYDISKSKLSEIMVRARRAGCTNVRVMDTLPLRQKFDLVVIDAPCSGFGTLRRGPDRLYKFSDVEAKRLARVQLEIVQRAREFLKPGGRLMYATCTVRPEENIHILHKGLSGSGLRAMPIEPVLKRLLGKKLAAFLTLVSQTPAARIAPEDEYLANASLQLGPSSQTSGGLCGDGFYLSLVH